MWAWDFYQAKVSAAYTVVVKPTRSLKIQEQAQCRIFTHSFDHPIGVVASHYAASQNESASQEVHGLFYSGVRCSDNSEKEFTYEQNKMLIAKTGTGFGFDDLLKGLAWKRL